MQGIFAQRDADAALVALVTTRASPATIARLLPRAQKTASFRVTRVSLSHDSTLAMAGTDDVERVLRGAQRLDDAAAAAMGGDAPARLRRSRAILEELQSPCDG